MKITLDNVDYDTEDMTEDQKDIVEEIYTIAGVLEELNKEVLVRQTSAAALLKEQQARTNDLSNSIKGEDK